MMEQTALKTLKLQIQHDIAEKAQAFYVDFCRLLEFMLKHLGEQYHFMWNTASLSEMAEYICSDVSLSEEERRSIKQCIAERNRYIHSPGEIRQADRTLMRRSCSAYNGLIAAIILKYPYFPCVFRLDESIFDLDFVAADRTELPDRSTADDVLREHTIADIEKELEQLRALGNQNSDRYKDLQFFLYENYKKQLPVRALSVQESLIKIDRKEADVFSCSIGINDADHGFDICGIKPAAVCKAPERFLYSVIHAILCKGRCAVPSRFLREKLAASEVQYNWKYILRYEFMILALLRHNHFIDVLKVNPVDGTQEELQLAFEDITHYLQMLARLQKRDIKVPVLKISAQATRVSVKNSEGIIYTKDKTEPSDEKNGLWLERATGYHICSDDTEILDELAYDLFGLRLKEDQRIAICGMLNRHKNTMCLMPTGYGKSLIFYFVAFLRPGTTVVVVPTASLLKDQIRNLKEKHGISNVGTYSVDNDFIKFHFPEKLIYVQADTFLNKSFLQCLGSEANEGAIGGIVLDEVHSLSSWSHEFRPDYIMLAKYLSVYVSNVPLFTFTATASVKVLFDLKKRLCIEDENTFETKSLKRDNIQVDVIESRSLTQNYSLCADALSALVRQAVSVGILEEVRSLIFVKNSIDATRLWDKLDVRTRGSCESPFMNADRDTYSDFVSGNTNFLIVGHDMGVGINLPNVRNCFHVGYPLSINQFIQEAGRTARESGESGKAYVYVQGYENLLEWEKEILDIGLTIDETLALVQSMRKQDSDIVRLFEAILGYLNGAASTFEKINSLCDKICEGPTVNKLWFYPVCNEQDKKTVQFYLILLSQIGILREWFYEGASILKRGISDGARRDRTSSARDITSFSIVRYSEISLPAVKERCIVSMRELGETNAEDFFRIKSAKDITDIILQYVEWYYNTYLLNQREQVINLIQAIDENDLTDYFEINVENLKEVKAEIEAYTIDDLLKNQDTWYDKKKIVAVKRLCEVSSNAKYDLFLLWNAGIKQRGDFAGRWRRVVTALGEGFIQENYQMFSALYEQCTLENRKIIIDTFLTEIDRKRILCEFYGSVGQDENFYILLASEINCILEENHGKDGN